jgi:hypothetical protein
MHLRRIALSLRAAITLAIGLRINDENLLIIRGDIVSYQLCHNILDVYDIIDGGT